MKKTKKSAVTTDAEACRVLLPPVVAKRIDEVRGDESRPAWILTVVAKELSIEDFTPRRKGKQPISSETIEQIKQLHDEGESNAAIARALGINQHTVGKYLKGD